MAGLWVGGAQWAYAVCIRCVFVSLSCIDWTNADRQTGATALGATGPASQKDRAIVPGGRQAVVLLPLPILPPPPSTGFPLWLPPIASPYNAVLLLPLTIYPSSPVASMPHQSFLPTCGPSGQVWRGHTVHMSGTNGSQRSMAEISATEVCWRCFGNVAECWRRVAARTALLAPAAAQMRWINEGAGAVAKAVWLTVADHQILHDVFPGICCQWSVWERPPTHTLYLRNALCETPGPGCGRHQQADAAVDRLLASGCGVRHLRRTASASPGGCWRLMVVGDGDGMGVCPTPARHLARPTPLVGGPCHRLPRTGLGAT